jgi:peptide subunit release factor 1 (eRF1)
MAGGGGRATLGLAPTLDALSRGEVQTLVVADELRLDGAECKECGRLDPEKIPTCPECGAATRPVHDLLHRAMRLTVEKSGAVEVVRGDAARRLMESGGGIGALLRSR